MSPFNMTDRSNDRGAPVNHVVCPVIGPPASEANINAGVGGAWAHVRQVVGRVRGSVLGELIPKLGAPDRKSGRVGQWRAEYPRGISRPKTTRRHCCQHCSDESLLNSERGDVAACSLLPLSRASLRSAAVQLGSDALYRSVSVSVKHSTPQGSPAKSKTNCYNC